jgi:hypothetical protein
MELAKYNTRSIEQWDTAITVGAQSIAPAQSIAHGQINDSISQKTKFLKNLFLQKIKNGKFSSRFLNKILQF